jgi:hypothetical protein
LPLHEALDGALDEGLEEVLMKALAYVVERP